MTAKIIDGDKISEGIRKNLKKRIDGLRKKGTEPRLDIILVGNNPASEIYVNKKMQSSKGIGMISEVHRFSEKAKQNEIIEKIDELNADEKVHGILVQIPLPPHINEQAVLDSISPEKDVDGLTACNLGKLVTDERAELMFEPCTPKGIIRLLEHEKIPVEGKHAVVIGRSNIVGKPLSFMLLKRNATVTICHSKTRDLKSHTKNADILVTAVGKANFVTGDMVKEGAVIIDAGISRSGGKVVGDVDFEQVRKKASRITPVPGGVGPLTVAMVLENTIIAAERKLRF